MFTYRDDRRSYAFSPVFHLPPIPFVWDCTLQTENSAAHLQHMEYRLLFLARSKDDVKRSLLLYFYTALNTLRLISML